MNPHNFFAELKRRNVYKIAVAYAIVGWLLIQIATQVFPFLEIPNWVVRLVIALVAIGFPIALIIAWAFELTPQGIKRAEDIEPFDSRSGKFFPPEAVQKSHLDLCRCDWSRPFRWIVFYRALYRLANVMDGTRTSLPQSRPSRHKNRSRFCHYLTKAEIRRMNIFPMAFPKN